MAAHPLGTMRKLGLARLLFDLAAGQNGANLRRLSDATPSGHECFSPKTQGGAGACPGLWDGALSGLNLVPFDAGHEHFSSSAWDNLRLR
jgi:hypothetical protein